MIDNSGGAAGQLVGAASPVAPGDCHVLLIGLMRDPKFGENFEFTLKFAKAGDSTLTAAAHALDNRNQRSGADLHRHDEGQRESDCRQLEVAYLLNDLGELAPSSAPRSHLSPWRRIEYTAVAFCQ